MIILDNHCEKFGLTVSGKQPGGFLQYVVESLNTIVNLRSRHGKFLQIYPYPYTMHDRGAAPLLKNHSPQLLGFPRKDKPGQERHLGRLYPVSIRGSKMITASYGDIFKIRILDVIEYVSNDVLVLPHGFLD